MVIVIIALLIRIVALLAVPDISLPDASAYYQAGYDLFTHGYIQRDNVMPLYAIWSYVLGGGFFLQCADIVLSVATVYLIFKLSVALFHSQNIGLIAAAITAVYPFFIFYSISRVTETAYIFLVCLFCLFFYKKQFFWGSVIFVLSILMRPSFDLLAPLLVFVFAFFVHQLSWKDSVLKVAMYCVIYFCLMMPWWIHNYQKYEEFVRLNLGSGIVLYYGNCCAVSNGGEVDLSAGGECYAKFSDIKDPVEKNQIMIEAAVQCVQNNPERSMELVASKFYEFWRFAVHSESWLKYYLGLFSYGVVLLISIVFLITQGKKFFLVLSPVFLMIVYLTSVHVLTFSYIRYRLPLELFLIIFASYMLHALRKKMHSTKWYSRRFK